MQFTIAEQGSLVSVVEAGLYAGASNAPEPIVSPHGHSAGLTRHLSSFVTLKSHDELRGCIGSIGGVRPLIVDLAHSAYAAATKDRRFAPLTLPELADLCIHISVLSPLSQIMFESESDLLHQLRPGVDGLVIHDGHHQATFLPVMWGRLPDPKAFLAVLKDKAELPVDYWSATLEAYRFAAEFELEWTYALFNNLKSP